jgi:hypothetical protein
LLLEQKTINNAQFFGGKTHPWKLDAKHIEKFLSHLATKGNFAACELTVPRQGNI